MAPIRFLASTALALGLAGSTLPQDTPLVPELTKLLPTAGHVSALFGASVAIDGETLVVGAPWESFDASLAGAVWVFERDGSGWGTPIRLTASDASAGDRFGISIDLEGETLAVGAWLADAAAFNSGAAYVFGMEPGPGTNYCTNVANSSGAAAWMSAAGVPSLAESSFTLHAMGAPPSVFGLFFYGADAFEAPFGEGTLCVSPFVPGLFRLPVVEVGAGGHASHALDWDAVQIQAGETWYFQFWFRDGSGGPAGWNLSDGLEVTFED